MGADHTKPEQLGHFQEANSQAHLNYASQETKRILLKKKDQIKQFLESQKVSIYPSPDSQVIKTRCRRPTKAVLQRVTLVELNAQSARGKNERFLSARDGRTQELNTARWPFSVHGVISFKVKGITTWGTGILIGPNVVLTSGHNLYWHNSKAYADLKGLQFLPAMNGQFLPFGLVEVEKYYVSPNYIKEGKEDYGILILKEPIGEVTGYFGLACLEPDEIKSKRINVTGYPSDKVAEKPNIYEMWGMEGEAMNIDKDRGYINYLIDTEVGQNGGGVWYQEGDEYYVCGVHVSGNRFVNRATLLTRAIYEQIYNWLHQNSNSKWLFKLDLTLDSIERLEFGDLQIDTDHLSFLMEYNLEGLTTLNLFSKKIGPEGAKILARNTSWINLSMLDLYNNQIGPKGCQALAENTSWINLSWLNLNRNNIGTEGAIALAKNTSWKNLSKLYLESNNIESEGALALAQNPSWTKLQCLNLASNNIDAEGAETLAKNSAWKNLKSLDLKDNDLTPEAEEEIARILAQNSRAPCKTPSDRIKIFW